MDDLLFHNLIKSKKQANATIRDEVFTPPFHVTNSNHKIEELGKIFDLAEIITRGLIKPQDISVID